MAPHTYELPPREQRHHWFRFLNPYYTALILHSVETRLARIYEKDVLRVQVLDFEWMPDMIRDDLDELIRMDHTKGDDGKFVFICRAWRRLFGITGLIVREFML
ncbi:hypothetical protein Tco_0315001 [Tanacetum coccineum]